MRYLLSILCFAFVAESNAAYYAITNISAGASQMDVQVNVEWFGAIGDDTNDDTVSIQSAIASGRDINFPRGRYLINSTLMLTNSDQTITGERGAWIVGTHSTSNIINIIGVTNLTLSGLNLTMPGTWSRQSSYGYGTMDTAISATNSSRVTIKNNVISNANYIGICLASCSFVDVSDNIVEACPVASMGLNEYNKVVDSADLFLYGVNRYLSIRGNKFISGSCEGIFSPAVFTADGNLLNSADVVLDIVVENNVITNHTKYGILFYKTTSVGPNAIGERVVVRNNFVGDIWGAVHNYIATSSPPEGAYPTNSYGHGISMAGYQDSFITGNTISNTCVYTRRSSIFTAGISVGHSHWFDVSGNHIIQSGTDAIYVNNLDDQGRPSGLGRICDNYISTAGRVTNLYSILAGSTNLTMWSTNMLIGDEVVLWGAGVDGAALVVNITSYSGSGTNYGIDSAASTTVEAGAIKRGSGFGIHSVGVGRNLIADNSLVDCYLWGIYGVAFGHGVVSGNQVHSGGAYGYLFAGCGGLTVQGNSSYANYSSGISFGGDNKRVTVSGNVINGSSKGIEISDTDSNITFDQNVFETCETGYYNAGTTNTIKVGEGIYYGVTTNWFGRYLFDVSGAGVPTMTNIPGSVYRRTDGSSASEVIYVGTGNATWTAK